MNARGQLARLRRLETGDKSPILKVIGSVEAFEEGVAADIAAGRMCPEEGPLIAKCVRKWVRGTLHYRDGNVMTSHTVRT